MSRLQFEPCQYFGSDTITAVSFDIQLHILYIDAGWQKEDTYIFLGQGVKVQGYSQKRYCHKNLTNHPILSNIVTLRRQTLCGTLSDFVSELFLTIPVLITEDQVILGFLDY